MVWARTKLLIQDDLLRPRNRFTIHYNGSNPVKFYKELPKLICSVFRIHDEHFQEKKISWTHGDPEKFKIAWEASKELDSFSYYVILVELSGSQSKNMGSANIVIEGLLRTEYPQDTLWQRSIIYEMLRILWHNSFYVAKRNKYMEEGRRLMATLVEEIKKLMHEK